MLKSTVLFLAASLALGLTARARMGDSVVQTNFRYGQPISSTGQPGALTSTQTFSKDGLTITCGYVKGVVEMESYSRDDRAFLPPEVEALLRTNGRHQNWTGGAGGFGLGTYHRADGATATVTQTDMVISSPKWTAALAKDKAAAAQTTTAPATQVTAPTVPASTTNAASSSATKP